MIMYRFQKLMNVLRSLLFCLSCFLTAFSLHAEGSPKALSYNHDILPILSENCFQCHGPDSAARKAGLRLDSSEEATKDRDGSAAIVPEHPEESRLIALIESTDEDDQMPPPGSNKSLSKEQKQIIRRWIKEGADYEKHWAFLQPIKKVTNCR
jgi:hypothetical protein